MDNLKPGGWVELVDIPIDFFSDDGTIGKAPNLKQWARLQIDASLKFGKNMHVTDHYKQWLTDLGFKNVKEDVYKVCLKAA